MKRFVATLGFAFLALTTFSAIAQTGTVQASSNFVDIPYSSPTGTVEVKITASRPAYPFFYVCLYASVNTLIRNPRTDQFIGCSEWGSADYFIGVDSSLTVDNAYYFYAMEQDDVYQGAPGTVVQTDSRPGTVAARRPINLSISPNPATIPPGAPSTTVTISQNPSSTYSAANVSWYGVNNLPPYTGKIWCLGTPSVLYTTTANVGSGERSTLYVAPYDGCTAGTSVPSLPAVILNEVSFSTTN
ncbi:hypothetical protein [Dyella silvatica]|uniref:hypothetical protein n=1 Tax=Dyella silvatica TaxID=2992128 RepID=UPI0022552212|nr:hypothetical protein [Dyella silvatica]